MNENDMIKDNQDLIAIMEKHNINENRFVRGVIFAEYIVNGENATNSYMWAFECSKDEARQKAANFRNSKWVQDLIKYFKPDDETLYFGERRQIIRKLMGIIDDYEAENKDKIAAANALAKYIKPPTTSGLAQEELSSDAAKLMTGLIKGIEDLSKQNKMLDREGNIIDVKVIE